MRYFISAVFLMFLMASCTPYQSLECTAITGFEVKQLNADGIEADVYVKIKNPNRWSFTVYQSSFDVRYGGVKLGKALLQTKVKIKAHAEEVYGFHISSDFKDITLGQVMSLLGGNFKNEFQLNGTLYAGKMGLRKGFPVDLTDHIKLK
jgi:LEA14-like dessication related protein